MPTTVLSAVSGPVLIEQLAAGVGGVASFDFQNIPQEYRHLRIEVVARSEADTIAPVHLRFNNDSGANYYWQQLSAVTTTVAATSGDAQTSGRVGQAMRSGSSQPGTSVIDIPFYALTTWNHNVLAMAFGHNGGGFNQTCYQLGLVWASPAAITRVTLLLSTGADFEQNSMATLYGIA